MDNTIDKSIQMDSQMKEFFECISGDADTQQQRIQCIRNGLAAIADRLRLGKAEITVDIPKNRFMPLGERSSAVLYEEEGAELGTPVDIEVVLCLSRIIHMVRVIQKRRYRHTGLYLGRYLFSTTGHWLSACLKRS